MRSSATGVEGLTGYTNQVVPLGLTEREIIFEHGDISCGCGCGERPGSGCLASAESGVSVAYDADKVVSQTVLRSKNKSITTEYRPEHRGPGGGRSTCSSGTMEQGEGPIIPAGSVICLVFTEIRQAS